MRVIVPAIFAVLLNLSLSSFAKTPVVEDSENFVLLEEQAQAAEELPVAQEETDTFDQDVAKPIVKYGSSKTQAITSRNTDFVNKVQALQKEVQELRGQIEMQAHELEALKQQLSFSQERDGPLHQNTTIAQPALEQPSSIAKPVPSPALSLDTRTDTEITLQPTQDDLVQTPVTAVRINPADEQISYLAAYDLIKQKQLPQAAEAMQQFLTHYPRGGYSANAHYWLGELYMTKQAYAEAITQFETVLHQFKSSSKYAPSCLKLGYALAESGRLAEARQQLTQVMKLYPDTPTAHLASSKLKKLGE